MSSGGATSFSKIFDFLDVLYVVDGMMLALSSIFIAKNVRVVYLSVGVLILKALAGVLICFQGRGKKKSFPVVLVFFFFYRGFPFSLRSSLSPTNR